MPTERRLSDLAEEVHLSEGAETVPAGVHPVPAAIQLSDLAEEVHLGEQAETVPAGGEPVPVAIRLSSLAGDVQLHEPPFHERVAGEILQLFKMSVIFTAVLTLILVGIDTVEMAKGIIHPLERLVTEKVLLALIGATVVQVGATSAAIVYSLFKTRKPEEAQPAPMPRRRRTPKQG